MGQPGTATCQDLLAQHRNIGEVLTGMALPDFRGSWAAGGSHGHCPLSPECWDLVGMEGGSHRKSSVALHPCPWKRMYLK